MDSNKNQQDQSGVISFLSRAESYAPAPDTVERIDTHCAIIFLAGQKAWKIKRAVRLPYLDFSTLEKRRAVCEREVEINRTTAPQIYLGIVPILRGKDGSLSFTGEGEPVEWAIEMTRFSQAGLLDRMAAEGRLPLSLMTPLTRHIAAYHDGAPVIRDGRAIGVLSNVVENIIAALETAQNRLGVRQVTDFARNLHHALADAKTLLDQRAKAGFVRRCHGDLHLRNIVLLDGAPTLFDAIEFDEDLATIDILYDLAFLLMDLWRRGNRAHANAVLNRYLWRGGAEANIAGLSLLPLFLSVRAGVRAMVTLDSLPHITGTAKENIWEEAEAYFTLACIFLAPDPPRMIAVGGLSGTGKSTLAATLAPFIGAAPGALHLRSDVERKLLYGIEPEKPLGAEAYGEDITTRVYDALNRKASLGLSAGHSVLADAVFSRTQQRGAVEKTAHDAGAAFDGLWLAAPEGEMINRVEARRGDASDANADIVRQQLDYDIGDLDWQTLDASGTADATCTAAAKLLGISKEDRATD